MKPLRSFLVLFALTCVGLFGNATAVHSDEVILNGNYAAIAYSPATGSYGYGYNHPTRTGAEAAALRNCKGDDARIVTWVQNGFCALAVGDDKTQWGVGWRFGPGVSNTDAARAAVNECNKRTTNARVVLCVCSANVAPYER